MAEIVHLDGSEYTSVEAALMDAAMQGFKKVLILGYKEDNTTDYRVGGGLLFPEANWLIDLYKHDLLTGEVGM